MDTQNDPQNTSHLMTYKLRSENKRPWAWETGKVKEDVSFVQSGAKELPPGVWEDDDSSHSTLSGISDIICF